MPEHGVFRLNEEKLIGSVEHIEAVLLLESKETTVEEDSQLPRYVVLRKKAPDAENPNNIFALFHPLLEAHKYEGQMRVMTHMQKYWFVIKVKG